MKITKGTDFSSANTSNDDLRLAAATFDHLVAGRAVELETSTSMDTPRTNLRGGVFFMEVRDFRVGFMLTHEIGHLLLVPERDLRLPNIGLTPIADFNAVPTDQAQRDEIEIAAIQLSLSAGLGEPFPKERRTRMHTVLKQVLGNYLPGGPSRFEQFIETKQAEWSFERIGRELDRRFALAATRAAVRVAA